MPALSFGYSNLDGLKIVKCGKSSSSSGTWTANKAIDITVTDSNIKESDILLGSVNISGASGDKIGTRFFISNGSVICNCMPTMNLSNVTVAFWYLVLRQ